MPFNIKGPELIVILVIVLIIFGAGRLPEVGGAIGKGIRSFRRSVSSDEEEKETAEKAAANSDKSKT